jgi:predicted RNase H-like nuclease
VTAIVAGVDGCRAGWVCVLRRVKPSFEERAFLARSFNEILTHPAAPSIIAVDIPIGFPERITNAGRECDCAAREVLGKRASSVFAPPARAVLSETDYRRACAAALATSNPPRKISKQMFHLFAKIREVDRAITPQTRVFECHPEATFWAMNERTPLAEPKKLRNRLCAAGLEKRRAPTRSTSERVGVVLIRHAQPVPASRDPTGDPKLRDLAGMPEDVARCSKYDEKGWGHRDRKHDAPLSPIARGCYQ